MAILEVRGLVKYYGRRKVVDGVDFEVDRGEVVGLLGPNGAGKTTSFRMATGQVEPNEGRVVFAGQEVTHLPMYRRARLGMGYLSQETSVFRKLSVEQNILAILEAIPVHRTKGRRLRRSERWDLCDQALRRFGIEHLRKNGAARLSGGEKRRLEIARCLVCDPLLILLDEPFTGIDPPTIAEIKKIILELRNDNIGILITDHQVREILSITDRSYLIHQGRVFVKGTPQEIVSNQEAVRIYIANTADGLRFENGGGQLPPPAERPAAAEAVPAGFQTIVAQDRMQTLVEQLRGDNHVLATIELMRHGPAAVAPLVDALEWREPENRRRALEALRRLVPDPIDFEPFAAESQRQQQLILLRHRLQAWLRQHPGGRDQAVPA